MGALDAIMNAGTDTHSQCLLRRHRSPSVAKGVFLLDEAPRGIEGMRIQAALPPVGPLSHLALVATLFRRARVEEALLGDREVTKGVRSFYVKMRARKELPPSRDPLGYQIKHLKRSYRVLVGEEAASKRHRALHEKEVRLLALLHDAGLPVLGGDRLGAVKQDKGSGNWCWEMAGVFGDGKVSKAMALVELRILRSRLFPGWEKAATRDAHLLRLKEVLRLEVPEP